MDEKCFVVGMNKFDTKDTGHAHENIMCLDSNPDPEGQLGTHNNEASNLSDVSDETWTICWKINVLSTEHVIWVGEIWLF